MPYSQGLYTLGTKAVYDPGDYALLLEKTLKAARWDELQEKLRRRRKNGEKVGVGVAMFVEKSGTGPFDTVRIDVKPDGAIEVITGVASVGQGVEQSLHKYVPIPLASITRISASSTARPDRIARGMGAFASRVTVMCGEATRLAATRLRARVLQAAAELMQTAPDTLDIVNGEIVRAGGPGPSMPLAELARTQSHGLSAGRHFQLNAHGLPLRRPRGRSARRHGNGRDCNRALCHRV